MDDSEFLKTEYAKQLIADLEKAKEDVREFNENWDSFWAQNGAHFGTVLIAHLIVEHYIQEFLLAANPAIGSFDGVRLSFAQKATLLERTDKASQWLIPGIRRLNKVRNDLAHDLSCSFVGADFKPIREVVTSWHNAAGKPLREGTGLIVDFALIVSTMMFVGARSIDRYGKGHGLVGYEEWVTSASVNVEH